MFIIALLPKCPFCVMAYGSVFASAEVATVVAAPWLAVSIAAAGGLILVLCVWRTRSIVLAVFGSLGLLAIFGAGWFAEFEWGRWVGLTALAAGFAIEELLRRRRVRMAT